MKENEIAWITRLAGSFSIANLIGKGIVWLFLEVPHIEAISGFFIGVITIFLFWLGSKE